VVIKWFYNLFGRYAHLKGFSSFKILGGTAPPLSTVSDNNTSQQLLFSEIRKAMWFPFKSLARVSMNYSDMKRVRV